MRVIHDYQGVSIRLTDERLAHILEHPEMEGLAGAIEEALRHPEKVVESLSDPEPRLYCRSMLVPASATSGCAWSSSFLARTPLSSRPISPTR